MSIWIYIYICEEHLSGLYATTFPLQYSIPHFFEPISQPIFGLKHTPEHLYQPVIKLKDFSQPITKLKNFP